MRRGTVGTCSVLILRPGRAPALNHLGMDEAADLFTEFQGIGPALDSGQAVRLGNLIAQARPSAPPTSLTTRPGATPGRGTGELHKP